MPIQCDENTILFLGPRQDDRIIAAERQIGRIANAHGIDRQAAEAIVALDGVPKNTAKMLIKEKANRHRASVLAAMDLHLGLLKRFEPLAQRLPVGMPPLGTLLGKFLLATGAVVIDFCLVLEIEGNDFVNQGQRQHWELLGQHLRRITLVVEMDNVIQPDTVSRECDLTIVALGQEFRQRHGRPPAAV
ncbi:MAG: hypothetical protein L0Y72_30650 [Gemmataceae bacterium]|nr:hypothetical protein [Gemmataceae bacterium]